MSIFHYEDLSKGVEEELSKILGRITHHIHPKIVEYITNKNIAYRDQFSNTCKGNVDINPFFYEKSDCVFPGFRRPINKEKTEQWKNNITKEDGCILNDNTFPRHIWAYLAMNKAYSGGIKGMWSPSGLDRFELAHIFGHKEDERALEKEVFSKLTDTVQPYGLFTSASNVVLIPKGFAKPTDHMRTVKICFYKRHLDLYGENICGISGLKDNYIPDWYEDIKWLEPELPLDWKEKIDGLLRYRDRYLKNKYSRYKATT